MTDMEIPGNARHAAADALIEAGFVDPDDGTVPRWHEREPVPVWTNPMQVVDVVLAAALPHLLTEVKSMCETATALGLEVGRREAQGECAAMLEERASELRGTGTGSAAIVLGVAKAIRSMASQPLQPVSNGLTASSRHPGAPEDTKPPQEGANSTVDLVGALRKAVDAARERRLAEQARARARDRDEATPDLPEESDQ